MSILSKDKILINQKVNSKKEAIECAGQLLVQGNHVTPEYIEKMIEREEAVTTYLGNGVAIPHGTNDSKKWIRSTGISIVQIPDGVDFGNGNTAYLVIGIAAVGDEHLEILSNLAILFSEEENVKKMVQADSADELLALVEGGI
ncbi:MULTISPECIES: PTS sugar transporter subunit IIA [Thermoactinomyces]|jgi:mannitol PTS system EIIA component|uniref:Mannitol-specific phosphotransferase enzyme IIA component n=1 Tax=Thermoactinomyces daqus TaxID=1329516 RepID=A0A7W1XCE9_9BACL|nr:MULTISPECIES: PTS sugar transporter subunit IIA [Thermoactinomyces]MBA4544097.1 PTS sugar transporter subunit IIA [Thermoactinomyces daqus]MBH8599333.1 PTS sugar transporter subunit IIA [Thermoactinomyces sp. CICC 10523]MBH8605311.1 PTS sugar transporter subunit IIA [Thermoactinomyces sp. CICC 10522]MBH8608222.1 PTS sugar transporter subunit IIA [Thermoactinomyces sp. CICC 10521]